MKLSTKVTKRDFLLLHLLLTALIIYLFYQFVCVSALERIDTLDADITQMREEELTMRLMLAQYENKKSTYEEQERLHADTASLWYPKMESYEIERTLTYLVLDHALEVQNLSVSASADTKAFTPYPHSRLGAEYQSEDNNRKDAVVSEILTSAVSLKTSGSYENIIAFLDFLTNELTSVRVSSYELSRSTVPVGKDSNGIDLYASVWTLFVSLDIYMYGGKVS